MATEKNTNRAIAKAEQAAAKAVSVQTKGIDETVIQEFAKPEFKHKALSHKDALARIFELHALGRKFNIMAQEIAIGILLHYEEHGDFTALQYCDPASPWKAGNDKRAPRLYEVIGLVKSRSMQTALIGWITSNSSLRWNDKPAKDGGQRFYHFKRDKRIPEGKAGFVDYAGLDTPFWEFEADPVKPQALPLDAILAIVKRAAERMVKLEVQKLESLDEKKNTYKVDHAIPMDLLKDTIALAAKYGVAPEIPEEVQNALH